MLPQKDRVSIPSDYLRSQEEPAFCADRFGEQYLQKLSASVTRYSTDDSYSRLHCFSSQTASDGRTDSFCIAGPASYSNGKFGLDCDVKELDSSGYSTRADFSDYLPLYWYNTGPRAIFEEFVEFKQIAERERVAETRPQDFSILIKREGGSNLWHSMMEMFSLFMSLDVLQIASDPATGAPFFSTDDVENTQIVMLDDGEEGPYFDLWTLFARKPLIKLKPGAALNLNLTNIIVPLAGGSNPFWQGDWNVHACGSSKLLDVFSQRVLDFYRIRDEPVKAGAQLTLTFIDRKGTRRLQNTTEYINKLRLRYPDVKIQVIDFAAMPFQEQLEIARRTDLLVGVHGAGLTHAIFQQSGSALVEIIPHDLKFKGFRNIAAIRGHRYFSSHAKENNNETSRGDWQGEDVSIEEDRFMDLLEVAIKSMYNRGLRNIDVS